MITYVREWSATFSARFRWSQMTMAARGNTEKLESDQLLAVLGERVRALRAHRGMTRKVLAGESGVSERYLAQLEQGQGNISVILLARVATALGAEPSELLRSRERRFSGSASGWLSPASSRLTERSLTFSSSRTFPGHE